MLFIWSFIPRFAYDTLGFNSISKYAISLSSPNLKFKFEHTQVFQKIAQANTPREALSFSLNKDIGEHISKNKEKHENIYKYIQEKYLEG